MGLTSSTMLSTLAHDEAGAGSAWCLTLLRVLRWGACGHAPLRARGLVLWVE
jgi:hypothetical protein